MIAEKLTAKGVTRGRTARRERRRVLECIFSLFLIV